MIFLKKHVTLISICFVFLLFGLVRINDLCEIIRNKPSYQAYYTYPWNKLGEWITQNVEEGAVIGSQAKELSVVVGNRKVFELSPNSTVSQFEQELRNNNVNYLLSPILWNDWREYEFQMDESSRFWFEPKYRIANLFLFKVHSRLMEECNILSGSQVTNDSFTATNLLRQGRKLLLKEEYVSAERVFAQASMLAPERAEVIFQHAISYEMLGDSNSATREYRILLKTTQAGSYRLLIDKFLQARDAVNQAQHPKTYEQSVVQAVQAAQIYWNLGYHLRANRLMTNIFKNDSTYFVGLLWGTHYALQLGDTVQAKDYLSRLELMDAKNPVVQAFRQIIAYSDSLHMSKEIERRSNLHLEIANIYKKIELNEEAIDAVQFALREDSINVDAMMYLAKIFEDKSRWRTAECVYQRILSLEPSNSVVLAKIDSIRARLAME